MKTLLKTQVDSQEQAPQSAEQYDQHWSKWGDFIELNPGTRHRLRIIETLLTTIDFKTVLDVGCGNGALINKLKTKFSKIQSMTGVDLSAQVLERNRREFSDVEFRTLDLEREYLNSSFELVTCSEVIEHLGNREAAFSHLAKMVSLGGYLLLTCPTGKVYETERFFGHLSHPSIEELTNYAAKNGFQVVKIVNWGFPIYKCYKWAVNLNSQWALERFANGSYSPMAKLIALLTYYANFFNFSSQKLGCQLFVLLRKTR